MIAFFREPFSTQTRMTRRLGFARSLPGLIFHPSAVPAETRLHIRARLRLLRGKSAVFSHGSRGHQKSRGHG